MSSGPSGRIAVDAMGGDLGPAEVIAAVKLAFREYPALNPVTLVGDEAVLRPLIEHAGLTRNPRLSVVHASEVITMDDKPLAALKKKKDSSMVRAIELVKSGEASVVVSCGNTGALMAGGTLRLRTMEGVARPALAKRLFPAKAAIFILIDAGANPEAKPEHLVHNAILGSNYARVMSGIASPRVGLMTIGTEEGKGKLILINETNELLSQVAAAGDHQLQRADRRLPCVCRTRRCRRLRRLRRKYHGQELGIPGSAFFQGCSRKSFRQTRCEPPERSSRRARSLPLKERINPERYGGAPLLGLKGQRFKGTRLL